MNSCFFWLWARLAVLQTAFFFLSAILNFRYFLNFCYFHDLSFQFLNGLLFYFFHPPICNFRYFHELCFQFLNGLLFCLFISHLSIFVISKFSSFLNGVLFPFSNWIFVQIFPLNFPLHFLIGFSFFNPPFYNIGYLYGLFCSIFKWSLILVFKLDLHFLIGFSFPYWNFI